MSGINQEAQNGSHQVIDYNYREGGDTKTVDGFENNKDSCGRKYAEDQKVHSDLWVKKKQVRWNLFSLLLHF